MATTTTVTLALGLGVVLAVSCAPAGARGQEGFSIADRVDSAEVLTPFRGRGPHEVVTEFVEWSFDGHWSEGYVHKPIGDSGGRGWGGVVFGHGLCAKAEFYDHIAAVLASHGYVVLATDEFSDCDVSDIVAGKRTNTTAYAEELERNALYLATGREDVDASRGIALVGHSMGGGGSLNAAAALAASRPGLVAGVAAIAPWNGVEPNPSTTAPLLDCPVLLICSEGDSLVPCSGPVKTEIVIGALRLPFASILPPEASLDYNGGVLAIYENVSASVPAILAVVRDANHLTIVDSDGKAGGTQKVSTGTSAITTPPSLPLSPSLSLLTHCAKTTTDAPPRSPPQIPKAVDYFSQWLEFPTFDLEPGQVIPTIEYAAAFVEWVTGGQRKDAAREMVWEGMGEDGRFVQPVMSRNPPPDGG